MLIGGGRCSGMAFRVSTSLRRQTSVFLAYMEFRGVVDRFGGAIGLLG